jgi:pimeloyl-ACP methyl ester carboxylesterase
MLTPALGNNSMLDGHEAAAGDRFEPFRIAIPDDELEELRFRLTRTRWADALEGSGWSYGADRTYLEDLVAEWRDRYDWRQREAALNHLPHYRMQIDGQAVHFIHQKGVGPRPLPLVLTHGWPSSFVEWIKVIGPLSDPASHGGDSADAFHVVVPSLPGFGFSDIPEKAGMTPRRIAALWVRLMKGIGYPRFGAHGCDWGAYITAILGLDAPERIVGAHMGMVNFVAAREAAESAGRPSQEGAAYAARAKAWRAEEIGYMAIQATKPQTLGYGLVDSPVGLAAWIVEKWRAWADCGGCLESAIDRTTLLTNISIYWFTRTINAANRLYRESRLDPIVLMLGRRIEAPCGFFLEAPPDHNVCLRKPDFLDVPRLGFPPREAVEKKFNVARWFVAPKGGHFPAIETPELLVEEIRNFFRPLRGS